MTEVNSNVGAIARWVPHVGQMVVNIDFGSIRRFRGCSQ